MISLILALSIQTMGDAGDLETRYRTSLSESARQELELVEKMKTLRGSIEELPDNWKTARVGGEALTKQNLLHDLEKIEVTAAERWSVLLNNTAFMDRLSEPKAFEARKELLNIPKAQMEMKQRIYDLNAKLKDEVLVNLASKVLLH